MEQNSMQLFADVESSARLYCRHFTEVFTRAVGSMIDDEDETPYLDFLFCAGAMNYGHDHPKLTPKQALSV